MNRINVVGVVQTIFEEQVSYLNLYHLDDTVGSSHRSLGIAKDHRRKNISGITVKITRTVDGDFLFEKVEEF